MDIGFTGTREGMTGAQRQRLQWLLASRAKPAWLHHGVCVGADAQAHAIALQMEYMIEGHPPIDGKLMAHSLTGFSRMRERLPYLTRNSNIVFSTQELIAAPFSYGSEGDTRGGTWWTVRYALTIGRKVTILLPDGRMEIRNGGAK